jgi:hypothetical protein
MRHDKGIKVASGLISLVVSGQDPQVRLNEIKGIPTVDSKSLT